MTPMTFRTLSIKGKLMLVTMLTSSVALLVASAGFLVYDLVAFRDRMSQDLMTEARIIGANSAAGLAFHDERAATEILAALKARDETVSAALYTPNGELFASYLRDGDARLPPRSLGNGYQFENHRLEVSQTVVLHGEVLGTLQIVSDMRHWDARLRRYTSIVFILMFGSAASRSCSRRSCRRSSPDRFSIWNKRCGPSRTTRTSRCGRPSRMTTKLAR